MPQVSLLAYPRTLASRPTHRLFQDCERSSVGKSDPDPLGAQSSEVDRDHDGFMLSPLPLFDESEGFQASSILLLALLQRITDR
jgi:hypothetical protein